MAVALGLPHTTSLMSICLLISRTALSGRQKWNMGRSKRNATQKPFPFIADVDMTRDLLYKAARACLLFLKVTNY